MLFAAASLACGLAPNVGLLIAARGVQGVGAAAMFATTMALISNTYSGRDRGMAFGIWGAVNGAASAVGPIIGGLLTANFGWRWIFLVNLPVSVVAVALTLRVVTESRDPRPRRVDVPGMVSFTVAAAALTYALIRGAWASTETIALIAVAAAGLVAFTVIERRSAAPMLDLRLLRNRTFTAMLLAGGLLSAAAWAGMTYQSLWLQSVLGLSAIKAGLVMLPAAAAAFIVSGQVGRFLHRTSPRWMVGTGLLVIGVGALAQAVLRQGSSWPVIIPGLVLVGIGAGLAIASMSATAMSAVPWQQAGMAAGALSSFRQLGYAFGIAVLGEVFNSGLSAVVARVVARVPGRSGPVAGAQRRAGAGRAGPHARARPGGAPGVRRRPRPRLRGRRGPRPHRRGDGARPGPVEAGHCGAGRRGRGRARVRPGWSGGVACRVRQGQSPARRTGARLPAGVTAHPFCGEACPFYVDLCNAFLGRRPLRPASAAPASVAEVICAGPVGAEAARTPTRSSIHRQASSHVQPGHCDRC